MAYQTTFVRYEIKYLLSAQQKEQLLRAMRGRMQLDQFGRSTIRNIYYDTDTFRLIRRSLEKPAYKEKLRIRSYEQVRPGDPVFVELKKKFQSVVYKRRLVLPEEQAMTSFRTGAALPIQSQIADEIEYFRAYYRTLHPTVFLSYDREAFFALDGSDFRITFDENIQYRCRDFSLGSPVYGTPLLASGQTLMEIKTAGGMPLWITHALTAHGIFPTSFSKYGAAYQNMLDTDLSGGLLYA
ncbi:polyphosphate polymerase domain-containing protein [Candidatus Agathobaculum pullicola]|uniref:polyphosphate polymerase domain-containing protein n=1 Tax=Candidatus Agathobaculum pullicola TaxID=2838426 RepID=UPI003F8FC086